MRAICWTGDEDTVFLGLFSDATMAVYFQYILGRPILGDIAFRQELLDRLNAISGIALPPDAITKRKTIPLEGLGPTAVGRPV